MYDLIFEIIGFSGQITPGSIEELVVILAGSFFIITECVLIDLLYRVLRSFWR